MGKHILRAALVALLCLLLGTTALARPAVPIATLAYSVAPGTLSGAGYALVGGTWQASGSVDGPGYHLNAGGVILQGAGCCCTYLPCVSRDQ